MIRKILSFSTVTAVALIAVGCGNPTVVNLNGDDTSTTATPTPTQSSAVPALDLQLSVATIDSDIGRAAADVANSKVDFTVTPLGGFTGSVTIHVTNLPAGVLIADVPVTISGTTPATGSIVIDAHDTALAVPGSYPNPTVTANGGSVSSSGMPLNINLLANFHFLTKAYPAGTMTASDFWGPDPTVVGSHGLEVHMGNATTISIEWTNMDGVNNHEIHRGNGTTGAVNPATFPAAAALATDVPTGLTGSNTALTAIAGQNDIQLNGLFPHGNAAIPPAGTTKRTFQPTDPTKSLLMDFHCHVHNAMPGRVYLVP